MPRSLTAGLAATVLLAVAAPGAGAATVTLPSCLWQRNDPALLNVLYPDAGAAYWSLRVPPGLSVRLRGTFPHARYFSLTSYDGSPVDTLLDRDVPADSGATNPFVDGARRTAKRRGWTVRLAAGEPPAAARPPGTLYTGSLPPQVILRVYVPDRGAEPAGGVPLPRIEAMGSLTALDASALPCPNARDGVLAGSLGAVQGAYATSALPVTPPPVPAPQDPPAWTAESGLTGALAARAGQDGAASGGPASNPHNRYLTATVAKGAGEVLAIRARAPGFPRTRDGEPIARDADLRYWSVCQNGRTTRYVACLADHEIAVDGDGAFTVAISDPAHRPAGARNWLPFGVETAGVVLYRHMLPSPAFFPFSAQAAAAGGGDVATVMGPYAPRAAYCSVARFERDACGLRAS